MKISITSYDKIYSVDTQSDGLPLDQVVDQFRGLLVSAGYHPQNVDEYFNTDSNWEISPCDYQDLKQHSRAMETLDNEHA